MIIDSIENGIVIDHIKAGESMKIYDILGLEKLECTVAILKNVVSKKKGRKDIIKISEDFDINLDAIGYIDPSITVNIIKDGKVHKKCHLALPEKITNVVYCKNPRCITTIEPELDHIFKLCDKESRTYRCIYCESKAHTDVT